MDAVPVALLFLDECMDEKLDLVALTGVLVPHRRYREVRDAMCKLAWDILEPTPNTIPAPIELHGSKLLPELNSLPAEQADAKRLHVFSRVVELINHNELQIFRFCYLNRSEIAEKFVVDPNLYALIFHGIQVQLHNLMETTLIIPIMDGIPDSSNSRKAPLINPLLIRAFALSTRWLHHSRQCDAIKSSLIFPNAHNLAEPVFADSTHSTMLQLVDLASYLLLQRDRNELDPQSNISGFKKEVIKQAESINPQLIFQWRDRMKFFPESS